jgi:hypothetical protein
LETASGSLCGRNEKSNWLKVAADLDPFRY